MIQPGAVYNVQPFKLDEVFSQEPTEFEISFVLEGVRHQYTFGMTPQRIVSESLVVYRTSKPTQWFSPRKHEAWERGYVAGRYGAVPFFRELPANLRQPAQRRSRTPSPSTPTTAA